MISVYGWCVDRNRACVLSESPLINIRPKSFIQAVLRGGIEHRIPAWQAIALTTNAMATFCDLVPKTSPGVVSTINTDNFNGFFWNKIIQSLYLCFVFRQNSIDYGGDKADWGECSSWITPFHTSNSFHRSNFTLHSCFRATEKTGLRTWRIFWKPNVNELESWSISWPVPPVAVSLDPPSLKMKEPDFEKLMFLRTRYLIERLLNLDASA